MLTDEQWAVLEPLVEACRPHAKVPPSQPAADGRARSSGGTRTGRSGGPLPEELGPWWMAAQTFIRWSRLGVWERLLAMAQERGVELGMAFLDGTNVRAHQKAAGARKKGATAARRGAGEALGRSRGGYGTKACVIADGAGRAVAFALAPGQAHELPHAVPLLDRLPGVPSGSWPTAATPATPSASMSGTSARGPPSRRSATRRPSPARRWIYNNRNRVERLWARLKEWRAVATRYEKTRRSFLGVLCLAATLDWLRR